MSLTRLDWYLCSLINLGMVLWYSGEWAGFSITHKTGLVGLRCKDDLRGNSFNTNNLAGVQAA